MALKGLPGEAELQDPVKEGSSRGTGRVSASLRDGRVEAMGPSGKRGGAGQRDAVFTHSPTSALPGGGEVSMEGARVFLES